MSDLPLVYAKAALLGLAVAAPPGPVAALCLTRTLQGGRRQGFLLGLSVATADMLVAGVVALGLGAILAFIDREHVWLQLLGGVVVAFFGLRMVQAAPRLEERTMDTTRAFSLFATGLLVTLTNPMTYAAFAAVIGALGLVGKEHSLSHVVATAGGVFTGSMLWWTALVLGAGFFRRWLDDRHVRWIHRTLGFGLVGLGILATASGLLGVFPE